MNIGNKYIQVILPLRLEWKPWYVAGSDVHVGQRVAVRFAGRQYVAVVSSVGGTPDIPENRVLPVENPETGLSDITPAEMQFWRFLSEYYLCTMGEVYKTAYPSGRTQTETRKHRTAGDEMSGPRRKSLDKAHLESLDSILQAFMEGRNVLYVSDDRQPLINELCRRTLEEGRDVLTLSPDMPKETFAVLRDLSEAVRSDVPTLIRGSKSCLFLPFRKLGLIIVDNEHSTKYKHSNQAPRYNARDAAAILAGIHGASLVLASSNPSLESFENAGNGKLTLVSENMSKGQELPEIIDTDEEFHKNGMIGSFSRKLLEFFSRTLDGGGKVMLLTPWQDTRDMEIEIRSHFPKARTKLTVEPAATVKELTKYDCVALVRGEFLLSKNDFRADEKAFRLVRDLALRCRGRNFIIQTATSSHPVWNSLDVAEVQKSLLAERRQFEFPPYTRMLEIRIDDKNEARKAKMTSEIIRRTGALQIFLKKDATLSGEKSRIASAVASIEKEKNYHGYIIIDVDPV